jgi:hypothetical protein
MRAKEIKLGVFMIAFSLALLLWLIPSKVEVFALGTFAPGELGPRSFPYLMACAIGLLGIALMVTAWRKPAGPEEPLVAMDALIRVLAVLVCSGLYLWLITLFGYMLPTFAATLALMYLFGERRIWLMIIISLVVAVSLFFVFGKVFHMLMPHGSIDFFYDL